MRNIISPSVIKLISILINPPKHLLLFLGIMITFTRSAEANTYMVNTAADHPVGGGVNTSTGVISGGSGAGLVSLRSAIIAANANAGLDFIIFSSSINGIPITLTITGANENSCATGDLDITDALTITGNGRTNTIVQAGTSSTNGIDKVFSVNPSFTKAFATSISGITIRYGRNPSIYNGDGYGGALDWEGSATGTLTIDNCLITDNTALDGRGGGLALTNTPSGNGSVTITNSTISNNRAERNSGTGVLGGGIFVGTKLKITISDCIISGNSLAGPTGDLSINGGGLFIL